MIFYMKLKANTILSGLLKIILSDKNKLNPYQPWEYIFKRHTFQPEEAFKRETINHSGIILVTSEKPILPRLYSYQGFIFTKVVLTDCWNMPYLKECNFFDNFLNKYDSLSNIPERLKTLWHYLETVTMMLKRLLLMTL